MVPPSSDPSMKSQKATLATLSNQKVAILSEDFTKSRLLPFTVSSTAGPFPMITIQHDSAFQSTAPPIESDLTKNLTLNHASSIRADPIEFGKQLSSWARGNGWRSYQDYIGGRIMYDGYSSNVIKSIMLSETVVEKIRELSLERLEVLIQQDSSLAKNKLLQAEKLKGLQSVLRRDALKIANAMIAKMDSVPFLRMFGAIVNNVLVRMYDQGIHVSLDEFSKFRIMAIEAEKKKISLLILPCHKSHIDYLTISWLFYRLSLSLPHIVAGDNLNLPIVGRVLQKNGAFYIKRAFGDDPLYPVVIREYIEQLLENGQTLECFIEGTRSRLGKLMSPKLGILKYVVEALSSGRIKDVMICPISIQYDRVIETESYIDELLGTPKEKETLLGLLSSSKVLQLKLGRIDVRFKEPFSLSNYLQENSDKRSFISTSDPAIIKKQQDVLLRSLGYEVLSSINQVSVIMPAALVSTVLLTIRGRGVGRSELIRRVTWLRSEILARNGRVAEFSGMSVEAVVDRALVILQKLVTTHSDLIEPVFSPLNRFELSFYRNQTIHLFVSDSIFSVVLYTKVKAGGATPSQRMTRSEISSQVEFLSKLFKNEFIYNTDGLDVTLQKTISNFEEKEIILVEDELIGLSQKERQGGRESFDFYCFILWPFIETYWLASVSLFALTPPCSDASEPDLVTWYEEKKFHSAAQKLGKSLFHQGDISYLESINQATMSNAFLRMIELGVILTKKRPGKPALMAIHPAWIPIRNANDSTIQPSGLLWSFLERLGAFRREGKNRRDHATVSTRVLNSCNSISPSMVEKTLFEGFEKPDSEFWASKPTLV